MIIDKDTKIFSQYGQMGYSESAEGGKCEDGYFSFNEMKKEYDKRVKEYEEQGLTKGLEWDGFFDEEWIEKYGNNFKYEFDNPLCELCGYEVKAAFDEDDIPRNECITCKDKEHFNNCINCPVYKGAKVGKELAKWPTWSWDCTACNEDAGKEMTKDDENVLINIDICLSDEDLKDLFIKKGIEVTEDKILKFKNFLKENLKENIEEHIASELIYFIEECEDEWNV